MRRRVAPYLLLGPGAAWLLLFFVVPLYYLAELSLNAGVFGSYHFDWHWANYSDALSLYDNQFVRSFIYAGLATLFALLLAYPLAYTIAFKAGRWRNVLLFAVVAPFFTTYLIRTLAWETILSDQSPAVKVLDFLGLAPEGHVLATGGAVIAGLTYNFLPFMVLPLFASIDKIDHRLIEAASDLYANPITAFRKVTWPLSLPGVVSGTLLTFIPAAGDYINAQLLGSPNQRMVGSVIQSLFTDANNYPIAGALSMILMLLIVAMVLFYVRRAGTEELL
jgi:spermidine/putrescine transport system permease protein